MGVLGWKIPTAHRKKIYYRCGYAGILSFDVAGADGVLDNLAFREVARGACF